MSIESAVVAFIEAAVTAAAPGSPLEGLEVHHTPYEPYQKDAGVSVLLHRAKTAPNAGQTAIIEFDGRLPLVCYARVTGANKAQRQTARDRADAIYKAVALLFYDDPTIAGAVEYARVVNVQGGWDAEKSQPYMVVSFELRFNEASIALDEN